MSESLKPIDPPLAQNGTKVKMEFVVSPSSSLFAKALGLATVLVLLVVALVFSLLVFSILAGIAMILVVRVWWARRKAAAINPR